jgi:hypothetical protein
VTIGATYASDLSRVRIECTSAPSLADYATVERSLDQITWVTVRGGAQVALNSGACQLDDYEFVPGQLNYYRARYVDTADPSVFALGGLATATNASVVPALPAGAVDGDVMVLHAQIESTSASVNTPTGWSLWINNGNYRIFVKVYASGDTAPTVSFTGGVAGDDTGARIIGIRNADFTISSLSQSNASAQNIAFPGMSPTALTPNLFLLTAWKQAGVTGGSIPGWTQRHLNATGSASMLAAYTLLSSESFGAGTLTITGGVAAVSKVGLLRFSRRPYVAQETASVTPTLTDLWLKNIAKPFLNRKIVVTDYSTIVQPSRSGSFPIVGRKAEIAVTDVRGGNRYSITVRTNTAAEASDLKAVLALGDTVLLHVPHTYRGMPGGYYLVGDLSTDRNLASDRSERRYHQLPLQEVAAPSDVVVGTTVVWQNIISSFATWSDLIAAESTWGDVMDRIGTPSDVVVP